MVALPFFHCTFSAIAGYYIGIAALRPNRARPLLIVGIGLVGTLHGLYNYFGGAWLGAALMVVILLLFVFYARSADDITRKVLETPAADTPRQPAIPPTV